MIGRCSDNAGLPYASPSPHPASRCAQPMNDLLDASSARPMEGGASFSRSNRISRAIWGVVWIVFASWTPAFAWPWRRFLLHLFGAEVAKVCDVRGSARVWYPPNLVLGHRALIGPRVNCYNMAKIEVGEYALVSQGAHLCAGNHDIDDPDFQLISAPITLKSRSWVAAEAFVGPGVTLGEGSVLGARAVALRDLEPWTLYVGNPASMRRTRARPADHAPMTPEQKS